MVDCPCGLGQNISPYEQHCPACGMDLKPLNYLEKVRAEREDNIQRIQSLERSLARLKKLALILPLAAFMAGYIIKPLPPPAVEAVKPPPAPVQSVPQPKPVEIVVERKSIAYTVKAGDSLSRIAYNMYGDSRLWNKIYEANKDTLSNPHELNRGQKLIIPE